MKISNIFKAGGLFKVLETTTKSQTAVMNLESGEKSSEEMSVHKKSDQVLLVVEGELVGEIGGRTSTLAAGDSSIVPAGTPHRFVNKGKARVVTFNVYAPPEYAPDEEE
jgi:mannose-6-phosphate isomerase-like protein (cupin superfamily)